MNRSAEKLHLRSRHARDEPCEKRFSTPVLSGENDDLVRVNRERDPSQTDTPITESGGTLDSEVFDLE